jgi:hypothetical protein
MRGAEPQLVRQNEYMEEIKTSHSHNTQQHNISLALTRDHCLSRRLEEEKSGKNQLRYY